jgi:hypothetical protein
VLIDHICDLILSSMIHYTRQKERVDRY